MSQCADPVCASQRNAKKSSEYALCVEAYVGYATALYQHGYQSVRKRTAKGTWERMGTVVQAWRARLVDTVRKGQGIAFRYRTLLDLSDERIWLLIESRLSRLSALLVCDPEDEGSTADMNSCRTAFSSHLHLHAEGLGPGLRDHMCCPTSRPRTRLRQWTDSFTAVNVPKCKVVQV